MKRLRISIWLLIVGAFVLLVVRTFFLGIYYVDSPSMEPTLHGSAKGGDCLLVAYGDGVDLERYDLVVFMRDGESEPFVKRVMGLPGEEVALRSGDLWIDREITRPDFDQVDLIPIFDEEFSSLERDFRLGPLWEPSDRGWRLDAQHVDRGANAGLMFMRLPLRDHYFGPDKKFVSGEDDVADAMIECLVEVETPGFVVRLGLAEAWDTFEAAIITREGEGADLQLIRNTPSGREILVELPIEFPPGARELRFANLNNTLFFWIDGALLIEIPYEGNSFLVNDPTGRRQSNASDRVYLGGSAGVGVFHGIRVFRDVHYSPRGSFAQEDPLQLGPAEIFVLGDNSRQSVDGREWGPIDLENVVGRPIGIVWPRERLTRFGASQGDFKP